MHELIGLQLALFLLVLTGCTNNYVALLEGAQRGGSVEVVPGAGEPLQLERNGQVALLDSGQVFAVDRQQLEKTFAAVLRVQPPAPLRFYLYFLDDGKRLTPESERLLARMKESLHQREPAIVSVIGHTDTLGDAKVNERIGLVRAQRVAEWVKAEKVEIRYLNVTSHSEFNPLVPTPDGTREPRNRRVEICIY
ncbi:OmpA family protein [Azomonas macrocytogenes]|uniref:Outer membrane protein OmpA-like peptidoglycan-associated protein n=1 Tax=Azomonas macrocytogenes TaxID=69962 RepID=A0A839T305_AZOMA|nr:outer membrane protein OmpA-like peptidoglycan-associated protein [Azomonas macrocytogenes]